MLARSTFLVLAFATAAITAACSQPWGTRTIPPQTLIPPSSSSNVLYVANRWGDSIFVYDRGVRQSTRKITQGVASPIALGEDSFGNLFVANSPERKKGWVSVYPPGAEKPIRKITSGITSLAAMAVDSAGRLFVSNWHGNAVYEYAPGTSIIERTITQGVVAPVALATDVSGYFYVSNCEECISPTQHDTLTIYAPKNFNLFRAILTSYRGPGQIGFDKSENLYFDDDGSIKVYAKRGSKPLRVIRDAAGTFTFDGSGNLYSAQTKYYNSGGRVLAFRPGESKPAYVIKKGIYDPGALTTDSSGTLYVANSSHNDIAVYPPGGSRPERSITVATGLEFPQAIAFDSAGNLYAANTFESTVTVYAPGSNEVLRTITKGVLSPTALAFDQAGNLYVANVYGNVGGDEVGGAIRLYAPGESSPFVSITKGLRGANYSLAFDRDQNLYVATGCPWFDRPITVYAARSGSLLRRISDGVDFPCAIAFDASGSLYVANVGLPGDVLGFPPGRSEPSRIIERGINYPDSLAFDGSGNLFVTNARGGNGETWGSVTVYPPGHRTPSRKITRGLTAGGGPGGSVFGPSGELYVVDSWKIVVYPPGGDTPVRTIRQGLNSPTSPVFDRNGNLFVANLGSSTVTEYAAGTSKLIRTIPAVEAYPDALIFGPP